MERSVQCPRSVNPAPESVASSALAVSFLRASGNKQANCNRPLSFTSPLPVVRTCGAVPTMLPHTRARPPALAARRAAAVALPPLLPLSRPVRRLDSRRRAAESDLLDLFPLLDDEEPEEEEPRHFSAQSLWDLNGLVSERQDLLQPHPQSCTNCAAPKPPDQPQCTYCGHESAMDADLLGTDPSPSPAPPTDTDPSVAPSSIGGPSGSPAPVDSGASYEQLVAARRHVPSVSSSPGGVVMAEVDARMLLHHTSLPPYPERPQRIQAIMHRLASTGLLQRCSHLPPREATDAELLAVHSPDLVSALTVASLSASTQEHDTAAAGSQPEAAAAAAGSQPEAAAAAATGSQAEAAAAATGSQPEAAEELLRVLDPAMLVGPHTDTAARLAAGAVVDVALEVAAGRAAHGVAVVRPPGHNASRDRAQGGCYYNSVAVAARAVQAQGAARRILIVDLDIHLGQGTHSIMADDEDVLYVSLHREDSDFYPYQTPQAALPGHSILLSWPQGGVNDGDYLAAFLHIVMPVAFSFRPDLILVSAGFDAADKDMQGGCSVSPACYGHLVHLLKGVAPVALALEGGYNLDQTARCMEACVRVLLGERPAPLPSKPDTSGAGWVAIMNVMQMHGETWPALRPLSWNGYMEVIKAQQQQQQADDEGEEGDGAALGDGEDEEPEQ